MTDQIWLTFIIISVVEAIVFALIGAELSPEFWKHRTKVRELEHVERLRAMELRHQRDLTLAQIEEKQTTYSSTLPRKA